MPESPFAGHETTGSPFAGYEDTSSWKPGESWMNPIQDEHPDMGMFSRIGLKTFADAGPETMIKNLENKGFEARHRGGMRFSLRRPGEKKWYVLDPKQFELLDDITDFIPGLLFPAAGTVIAGAKGAALGGTTLGPPGAVVGGVVGSAGGGAAGEAIKMGAGKALGYEYAPEEVGEKIATEAKLGAAAQALAPAVQVVGGLAKEGIKRGVPAAGRVLQRVGTNIPGPVAEAAQKLRRGTAAGLETAGKVVGLPGRGYDYLSKKFRDIVTPGMTNQPGGGIVGPFSGIGLGYMMGVGPQVAKGIAIGLGSKIAGAGLKKLSSVIMGNPRVLLAYAGKATGNVAAKLQKPLAALQKRGTQAYKAAVFTMLHDPEVRAYLQDLEKKKEKNE